jgi:hypothetical protein
MLNFVYLRSSSLKVFHFWLDLCIANKGEKFELEMACWMYLEVSYGPPWAHYLGGFQDRLLGGPLGLPDLCRTVPFGVRRKDYGGEVLG